MASRELAYVAVLMALLLVLLTEVPVPVYGFSDTNLVETQQDLVDNDYSQEWTLPRLLKLLGSLLWSSSGNGEHESLEDKKSFSSSASAVAPYDKSDLTSLLDQLSPSRNQDEAHTSYKDTAPLLPSKRGRDSLMGAMPPLNELCRMMRVRCYK